MWLGLEGRESPVESMVHHLELTVGFEDPEGRA